MHAHRAACALGGEASLPCWEIEIANLIGDSGALVSVSGLVVAERRFAKIALEFAAATLILRCEDDTDEIVVQVADTVPDCPAINHPLLVGLIEMTIADAWTMTNQRGYDDAFQVRFVAEDRSEETRQFEVAASAMDVYRVAGRSDWAGAAGRST